MNLTSPQGMREVERELFTKTEFVLLLRRAAAMRTQRKADRLRAYESMKRQLDRLVGWSSRDAAMTPTHWDCAIGMLCKALGV